MAEKKTKEQEKISNLVPQPNGIDNYLPQASKRRLHGDELNLLGKFSQNEVRNQLSKLSKIFDESYLMYYGGEKVPLPTFSQLPFQELITSRSDTYLARRHAGLITGHLNFCKGTDEIAGWIANVIDKVDPSFAGLALTTAQKIQSLEKMKQVGRLARFQHRLRVLSTQIRIGILICPDIPKNDWEPALGLILLAIMSELRESGQVLLPSDFYFVDKEKAKVSGVTAGNELNAAHATAAILRRDKKDPEKIFFYHFESNGFGCPKIRKKDATSLRISKGRIDRSKTFDPKKLNKIWYNERYDTEQSAGGEIKVFMKKTLNIAFKSLGGVLKFSLDFTLGI